MTTISKTTQTFPQRKAVAIRRALGMLALVGLFALPQAASAQSRDQRGDGDRVERQITHLDEALDLTGAQATRLRALFQAQEANRPAPGARRSGSPDDRAAMQAQRQAQRAEMDRQIEAVLTPAQVQRFRALRAERQNDGSRGQRDGQRPDGR